MVWLYQKFKSKYLTNARQATFSSLLHHLPSSTQPPWRRVLIVLGPCAFLVGHYVSRFRWSREVWGSFVEDCCISAASEKPPSDRVASCKQKDGFYGYRAGQFPFCGREASWIYDPTEKACRRAPFDSNPPSTRQDWSRLFACGKK
jgi:hypothetical protein